RWELDQEAPGLGAERAPVSVCPRGATDAQQRDEEGPCTQWGRRERRGSALLRRLVRRRHDDLPLPRAARQGAAPRTGRDAPRPAPRRPLRAGGFCAARRGIRLRLLSLGLREANARALLPRLREGRRG